MDIDENKLKEAIEVMKQAEKSYVNMWIEAEKDGCDRAEIFAEKACAINNCLHMLKNVINQ